MCEASPCRVQHAFVPYVALPSGEAGDTCSGPSSPSQFVCNELEGGLEQQPWHGTTKASYALGGPATLLKQETPEGGGYRFAQQNVGRPLAGHILHDKSVPPLSPDFPVAKKVGSPTACLSRDGYYGIDKIWFGPDSGNKYTQ